MAFLRELSFTFRTIESDISAPPNLTHLYGELPSDPFEYFPNGSLFNFMRAPILKIGSTNQVILFEFSNKRSVFHIKSDRYRFRVKNGSWDIVTSDMSLINGILQ